MERSAGISADTDKASENYECALTMVDMLSESRDTTFCGFTSTPGQQQGDQAVERIVLSVG